MENLDYYRKKVLKNFNTIESITKNMIQVTHPDIEKKFWQASDNKDVKKLILLSNQTDKLIDNLRMN